MAVVSMNYLLEAGVHFGHQTKRWNPKMKDYIFTARDDIHIIDLQKTEQYIEEAYNVLKDIVEKGGKVLFVGTKKQAQEAVKEEAERTKMFYVSERWLGGTLTNFKTIRRSINYLMSIEKMEQDGTFEKLPKKEVIDLKKEYEKLNKNLCGIREMMKLPDALVIVDPNKEMNAIKEARKLNIPVIGLVDTNCDPDTVDYVVPANDDAIRAVKLVIGVLNNAVAEVTGAPMIDFLTEEDKGNNKKNEVKKEEVKEIHEEKVEEVKVETKEEVVEESKEEIKEEPKKVVKKAAKKEEPKEEVKKQTKKVAVKKTTVKKVVKEDKKEEKKPIKKAATKKKTVKKETKTTKKTTKKAEKQMI